MSNKGTSVIARRRAPVENSEATQLPRNSMSPVQWPESVTQDVSRRLRWIADYLDLAERAISVLACVQGLDCPPDVHRGAQQDLRRWARWLEVRPAVAAGFAVARVVPSPEDGLGRRSATVGARHSCSCTVVGTYSANVGTT